MSIRRQILAATVSVVALASVSGAHAQSLTEALGVTYENNPTLLAQRAALAAANEQVPQAQSGYRPTVQGTGSLGVEWQDQESNIQSDVEVVNPASIGITIDQPIYQGGETAAAVDQALAVVQTARIQYLSTEQQVLLDAITSYMNVVLQEAVLQLTINNEQVLQRQLEAARDRFAVGEITRTDVSQAESRLAGATANRIEAEGDLRTARAVFERVVGFVPTRVEFPPPAPGLTTSLEETISLAEANNPVVLSALFNREAAEAGIRVARAGLLPDLSLQGQVQYSDTDLSSDVNDVSGTTASLTAQLVIPLYQAGLVSSQVREQKKLATEALIQVDEARREAIEGAISGWENLTTARASIQSLQAQVAAAEVALEGVEQEAQVGSRTVLDVLDAEQELLNARVDLVQAQRDEAVAEYQLLSAVGRLTARYLDLPVAYFDFDADYEDVENRFWGTRILDE